ncbi:uncharacterized protein APUU_11192A [Aspergillus puulaauensis]|uniref:non-specific serine/threonine protein kinase n=1 Tax=Aspergillus puulaauensis TaxID=1220207 RepID=A0A7R7XBQ5_9EURO|nr:uncharacterized protein APUU_11192A [Aspergillus puulaauensis]BCS18364.1 hypothetical protein APUU_11192A [Aspergillus puulaauensis]
MRRFERIHDVVEPVEEYRPGGYHPVHLHDVFSHRYKIIAKLAYGQFSTVWLANDIELVHGKVALKILKADASKDNTELSMLLSLSGSNNEHPGRKHAIELLDHFYHAGPNGNHLCLVLPAMISDGQAMVTTGTPHQAGYIQWLSRQILLGLDFIHQSGIVHCDLQPANILVSVTSGISDGKFMQPPELAPVKWLNGVKQDDSAPEYLIPSQRRRGQLDNVPFSALVVKIGDLGGAQWMHQCGQIPVTPRALRAPELITCNSWEISIDTWALGCLIFELATNEPLFPLGMFGLTRDEIDKEHEGLISQLLDSTDRRRLFTTHLADRLMGHFGADNLNRLADFLLLMLQRSPQKRPSAKQLLSSPFLADETK